MFGNHWFTTANGIYRSLQGAAADSESKSEELSRAVEELHKLLKDAGEGEKVNLAVPIQFVDIIFIYFS